MIFIHFEIKGSHFAFIKKKCKMYQAKVAEEEWAIIKLL